MKPRRILMVIPGVGIGGIATGLLGMIRHLDSSRYRIVIAVKQEGSAARLIRKSKIRCLVLPAKNRVRYLANVMIREQIQIVQSCDAAGEGALAAKLLNLPHVWHVGGNIDSVFKARSKKSLKLFRTTMSFLSHRVVVQSRSLARAVFPDLPKQKLHVIPWGVDQKRIAGHSSSPGWLRRKLGFHQEALLTGLVANFYPEKRHLDFLKAANLIHQKIPRARFVIAGQVLNHPRSVGYKKSVIKTVRRLKLGNLTKITSFSDSERTKFYQDLNLIVFPSYEGLSQAMLEAGISGVPMVAADIGGAPEVIRNNQSGLLTPFGSVRKMAQAAVQILKNPALAKRFEHNARRRILSSFMADRQAKKFDQLYQGLLS